MDNKTLSLNTDYTVDVVADLPHDKGIVTVTGKGDYSGSVTKEFSISVIVPTEPTTPTEPTNPTEPKTIILCDVDSDGEVTIIDATCIQRKLANIPTAKFVEAASDADEDGDLTIIDATVIQRWLAQLPANDQIGQPIG